MTVHFIGAGPGAADLLTVRAVRLIESSPVCVYAGSYIDAEILAHCPSGATLVDSQHLDLDQITDHLVAAQQRGEDVARLCSGDPSIYSALAEQTRRLDQAGVSWDVTPGVPAYAAAAAIIKRELTVPELAQTVILTRTQAASTAMPESESLGYLAEDARHHDHPSGDSADSSDLCRGDSGVRGGLPGRGGRECHAADRVGASRDAGDDCGSGRKLPACGRRR